MTFTNSILAGETLVRHAIKSENFEDGSAGWRIQRDGNAQFNEVTARGETIVEDSGGNYVKLYIDGVSSEPVVEFYDVDNDLTAQIGYQSGQLRTNDRSNPNGQGIYNNLEQTNVFGQTLQHSALVFQDNNGSTVVEAWRNMDTSVNDWSARGSGYEDPAVKLNADGLVDVKGSFNVGTTGSSIHVANILDSRHFPVNTVILGGYGPNGAVEVQIDTNGQVNVWGNPGGVMGINGSYRCKQVSI